MNADERRAGILLLINEVGCQVKGSLLAERFGVTRQVIVQDIAILRAGGAQIVATPQGYCRPETAPAPGRARRVFVVRHSPEPAEIEAELNAVVDLGGKVLDVTVEHPVYGDLTGSLMLGSRLDVTEFLRRLSESKAEPLLVLREGVHLHTIEASDGGTLDVIGAELDRLGLLLNA